MVPDRETRTTTGRFLLLALTALPLFSQQINLQTSLLPAAPLSTASPETQARKAPVPAVQPAARISARRPEGETLLERADNRFQRGQKLYRAKDAEGARREFDSAIELLLRASDTAPDRDAWERKTEEMVDAIHRYDLAGLGAAALEEEAAFEKAPLEDILELTFPVDPKLKLQVREQLMATVSQLPLSVNDQVLGYMRYFSTTRGHATVVNGLRRAGRYRPLIQRILAEEGLPQELIHLAQAESGFQPRAVSRMAAGGMWQFVRFRGREYGLNQDSLVDERYDPEKATRAAARHLRDLYRQFGDWYLAIAAYNCGPGNVSRAVERSGYADFWELRSRNLLPRETSNYVPIILALTIMTKNAAAYGLADIVPDPPLEYDSLDLTAATHLELIGDLTGAPVAELKALNPAVLKQVAAQGYTLRVPAGAGASLAASLQMVPPERRASWRIHQVQGGDTLAAIGKRYGAAPGAIVAANRMQALEPVEGDRLVIPAAVRTAVVRAPAAPSKRTVSSRTRTTASARAAASKPVRKSPPVLARTASAKAPRRSY